MSKITEIEDALNRINGDIFQDFCNHFLHYKLNPNSIDPIGSVIGKEKSRKGIPDCYFTSKDGKLILAEYTSKEKLEKNLSFLNKLKQDILNCFDESKTKINSSEIEKVILCYTDKLKPDERIELIELCKKHNSFCLLELYGIRDLSYAVLDYPPLGEYLNIKIGTGQILPPSDFIKNYEKSKLSTPLSNSFFHRKKELETGLKNLETNNIIIVYGSPGTGKSKYSVELCKQFAEINVDYEFLCIGNNGLPIWDDIHGFIRKESNYLIFIDDANRHAINFKWILSILNQENNIKIVVSVRDYALSVITDISKEFGYSTIEIKEFLKDEIQEIITSDDFKIKNPAFIDRILSIAKGNARLAIMCARVALEADNLLSLNDASQIYEEYYSPICNEIKILSEPDTLKTLAIISFFGKFDKANRAFCDTIFTKLSLDEDIFWQTCYDLNKHELVDLFETQIVKISDQIFSTYIFYKAVIDLNILSFKFFLDNYIEYQNRINDTIIPVINTFSYKKIEDKLKAQIVDKWKEIEQNDNHEQSLQFLSLFWYYLAPQVLVYCKKHIDSIDEPKLKTYRYSYETNEFSHGTEEIITILSRFRLLKNETFRDALDLLFYYALKFPNKLPAIVYTIKESFSFNRLSYQYDDIVQHTVLDFLISKSLHGSEIEIYENILLEIIPHFLKIEYKETTSDGRKFTIHTFYLGLTNSIKSFRKKCFDYLSIKVIKNKSIVLQTIYNVPIYEYKHSNEIYYFDSKYIFQIFYDFLNPECFEDCFVFQNFTEKFSFLKKNIPKKLKQKFTTQCYKLTEVLIFDRTLTKKGLSWEDQNRLYEEELIDYCKNFQFSDYLILFDNINSINVKTKHNNDWQYINSLNIILSYLAKTNYSLFIEVLNEIYKKYDFKLNYCYLFNSYFSTNSKYYLELFNLIEKYNTSLKLSYHISVLTNNILPNHIDLLYHNLKETIKEITTEYCFYDLTFIGKYAINRNELLVYQEILNIILFNIKKHNVSISAGSPFLEKCLEIEFFPYDKIVEAYFFASKIDNHFDYELNILKKLFENDKNILIEFLNFKKKDLISHHDTNYKNYDFIWEHDDYINILISIIDYHIENKPLSFEGNILNNFFPNNQTKYGNKPLQFIYHIIKSYINNSDYMITIFNVICYSYRDNQSEFLKYFLSLNTDFQVFKKLDLITRNGVTVGSRIPYIETQIKSWNRIASLLDEMPNRINYLEHKEYVDKKILYCEQEKQREIKWEFLTE